jgi:hypothetical protein
MTARPNRAATKPRGHKTTRPGGANSRDGGRGTALMPPSSNRRGNGCTTGRTEMDSRPSAYVERTEIAGKKLAHLPRTAKFVDCRRPSPTFTIMHACTAGFVAGRALLGLAGHRARSVGLAARRGGKSGAWYGRLSSWCNLEGLDRDPLHRVYQRLSAARVIWDASPLPLLAVRSGHSLDGLLNVLDDGCYWSA